MPTVNQDYLCVINVANGKTTFEKVDIPQSTELLATLEQMTANPNRTVLDLQSHMNLAYSPGRRGYINYVSPYGYSSSYIAMTSYPSAITHEEYCGKLEKQAETIRAAFDGKNAELRKEDPALFETKREEYVEKRMEEYKASLKDSYLSSAKRFIMASDYRSAMIAAKSRPGVRMYSTDTLGWSSFEYRVTDDVTITIGTNFGYGSSSYFHLGLRYKGIDVLPYSFVVRYYHAKMDDIIRYTRRYEVAHESWNLAFDFVEEMANLAAEDPDAFVNETIVNEIREMIGGLRVMLEPSNSFMERYIAAVGSGGRRDYETVWNMDLYDRNKYRVYPEEMGMAVKAEKITGSLDFLGNLTRLSETIPYVKDAIGEIIEMSAALLPQMESMMARLDSEVTRLEERLAVEDAKMEKIRAELKPHDEKIDRIYDSRKKDDENLWRSEIETEYREKHEDYAALKEQEAEQSSLISKLRDEKMQRGSFRSRLEKCVKRVEAADIKAAA